MDSNGQLEIGIVLVIIVLLIFSLVGLLAYQVLNDVNTETQADSSLSNTTKETLNDLNTRFPSTIDGAFMVILVLLIILMMVAGYFAGTHPIFIIVTTVLFFFLIIISMVFSNVWEEFTDDPTMTFESSFPIMNFTMDNFLIVILTAVFLITIATMAGYRK